MAFLLCYSLMVYQLFGSGGNRVSVTEWAGGVDCPPSVFSPGNVTKRLNDPGPPCGVLKLKLWFQIPMIASLAVLTLYEIYQACRLRLFEEHNRVGSVNNHYPL